MQTADLNVNQRYQNAPAHVAFVGKMSDADTQSPRAEALPPADDGAVPEQNPEISMKVDPDGTAQTNGPSTIDGVDDAEDKDAAAKNGLKGSDPPSESRIPQKKDATLREFLGKMDDYAPIVRSHLFLINQKTGEAHQVTNSDPRRGNELLPHPGGAAPTASDLATSSTASRPSDAEVYRRHRRRSLPVLTDTV